jgi:hypothetical protein
MRIAKADIVAALHSRGLDIRADWADRQLPDPVETDENASLLATLGIDVPNMSPVEANPETRLVNPPGPEGKS